jgi:hypothetical protein
MKDIFWKLVAKSGKNVARVIAHVLFYNGETEGEIYSVVVEFEDLAVFEMACAGDGRVVIRRVSTKRGLPPNIEEENVPLEGMSGLLGYAKQMPTSIVLDVGGRSCEFENSADEILIYIDKEDVSPRVRSRRADDTKEPV